MKPLFIVFAKPPVPGEVKTRLARAVGDRQAAALARAFFLDTWNLLRQLPCDRVIASTREDAALRLGAEGADVWLQGEGDLATRLHRIFDRALRQNRPAIALGADSPGLPKSHLLEAASALHTNDAVIGPAEDGGFYLVGLRSCPAGLFHRTELGTPRACQTLQGALAEARLKTEEVTRWFDVDEEADLHRLRQLLRENEATAPLTAEALEALPTPGES